MNWKISLAGAGIALALLGATASSCEVTEDAPVNSRDTIPADVYNMPDGFSNFATKCDKSGNRVYTIYHGASTYGAIAVVPQDPTCAKVAQ